MSTPSTFYPNLGSLVKVSNFPESLSFMKLNKLQELLDKVYYRHLQFSKSPDGSQASYDLNLIFNREFDFDIFDTGFSLVLFPLPETNNSGLDISLNYTWPILRIIDGFKTEDFDYSLESLKDIVFKHVSISANENIDICLSLFEERGATIEGIRSFVDKVNPQYSLSGTNQITVPSTGDYDTILESVVSSIESSIALTKDVEEIIEELYLYNINNLKSYVPFVLNTSIDDFIKETIIPNINATIGNISLGFAFPRNILLPVKDKNGNMASEEDRSMFIFNAGELEFSTENGITFTNNPQIELNFDSQIGNTGIGISFTDIKLDLSHNRNIPEADLDGRPDDFRGIFAEEVGITLPEKWFKNSEGQSNSTLKIVGRNILAGTGGLSGIISLEAENEQDENAVLWKKFGDSDFAVGFEKFNLEFRQNTITKSEIKGRVIIPGFEKLQNDNSQNRAFEIGVTGCFTQSGDFNLTADVAGGTGATLFNLITFNFLSMSFGKEGSNFFIAASCEISFPETNKLMYSMFGSQKIMVPNLRIYDNGKIEIEGGSIPLPGSLSLSLKKKKSDGTYDENAKPVFGLSITDIVFGSSEKDGHNYNYFGFDGAVSLGPLGVDARGKGIKYYFRNGHSYLRLQTIEIDLVIPGTASASSAAAIIKGSITMPDPEAQTNEEREEYRGEIYLSLPKINLSAGAKMRLKPNYPAFAVDAYLNLPSPIPIGPVGIYGFRGIVGYRYVAQKGEQDKTWYDYFKRPPRGISIDKFVSPEKTANAKEPFSIGAGAVIGTSFDNGRIISASVMLLLSIPDMFTVEGKATMLSERMKLGEEKKEPPFYARLTWATDAIEFEISVDLSVPSSGKFKIITLQAGIEACFPKKTPGSWYVNAGTRKKPITASILENIFDLRAQSFLMLSSKGMEAGARVDFEFKKSLLGIKLRIYAYVGLEGKISFERPQIGGSLYFGGGIEVNVWRVFYVSLNLDAALSMEVPKPFKLYASLKVHGKLKVIGFKVKYNMEVKLQWEKDKSIDMDPICPLILEDPTSDPVKAVHMLTNETYTLNRLETNDNGITNIKNIIPIDSYVDIKIGKGVQVVDEVKTKISYPSTSKADSYTEKLPPVAQSGSVALRQVKHTYSIESFNLKTYSDGRWIDYNPYVASHPKFSSLSEIEKEKFEKMKAGSFQVVDDKDDYIRLLTNNPFSYIEHGRDLKFEPEEYGITPATVFCPMKEEVHNKVNVLNKENGTIYYFNDDEFKTKYINGVYFKIKTFNYNVNVGKENNYSRINALRVSSVGNPFNFDKSLFFSSHNSIQIDLTENTADVKLKLGTQSQKVTVSYYGLELYNPNNPTKSPLTYKLLNETTYTRTELNSVIQYQNSATPIRRIIITPYAPDVNEILNIKEEIQKLIEEAYNTGTLIREEDLFTDANVSKLGELVGRTHNLLDENYPNWHSGQIYDTCKLFVELAPYYPKFLSHYIYLSNLVKEDCIRFYEIIENYLITFHDNIYWDGYNWSSDWWKYYGSYSYFIDYMDAGWPGEAYEYYVRMNEAAFEIMKKLYYDCLYVYFLDEISLNPWTALHELEYLTIEQKMTNDNIPGLEEKAAWIQSAIQSINEIIQPVWHPDRYYRFDFTLKDNVNYANDNKSQTYNYCYGFKTAKTIGHIEQTDELTKNKADKLNDLASYIDFNRSYPNADGNLLDSKPVFYGHRHCKIDIFFTKTYASRLISTFPEYTSDNTTLSQKECTINIKIKDPVSEREIPYPLPSEEYFKHIPKAIPMKVENSFWPHINQQELTSFWKVDSQPILDPSIELVQNYLDESNEECNSFGGHAIVPKSTLYTLHLTNLKPQKLYTALVCNYYDDETKAEEDKNQTVHEFVFKTSRYYSFKQQVESYKIKDKEETPLEYTEESILLGHDPEEEMEETVASKDAIYLLPILSGDKYNNWVSSILQKAYLVASNYPSSPATGIDQELYSDYPNPFDRVIEGLFEIKPMEAAIGTEFNILTQDDRTVGILIRNPEPFNNPRMPANDIIDTIVVMNGSNQNKDYKILHSKDYSQALIMYKNIYFPDIDNLKLEFRYKLWKDSATPNSNGAYVIEERIPVELKLKQGIEFWEIEKDFTVSGQ